MVTACSLDAGVRQSQRKAWQRCDRFGNGKSWHIMRLGMSISRPRLIKEGLVVDRAVPGGLMRFVHS